tara:strand:+ start:389 stop:1324 length:936 start_codon:yes stop_codon:yes gene_type:complete
MKRKFFIKKVLIILIFFQFNFVGLNALENKILFKVNNEIITTLDIFNQANYLKILNPEIDKLDNNRIIEIAKNSIIREKVKKIGILKLVDEIKVSDEYLKKILSSMAKKRGMVSLNKYKKFLKENKVQLKDLKHKISIDSMWNEIIYSKFNSKVVIDKVKIVNEINNNPDKKLLLSEILFKSSNKDEMKIKYQKIKNDIDNEGFKNAALIHSISNSSTVGGDIGWVNQNSLNNLFKKKISNLRIGEYSEPILTPSGFLILKIENIENIESNTEDINKKIDALVRVKTNQQLNQYSNIYFNKIKKDLIINEL